MIGMNFIMVWRTSTQKTALAVLLVWAFAALGCKSGGDANATAASEEIGIAACDAYFQKVSACLGKVPPDQKAAMESSMKANRQTWRDIAKNAAARDNLKAGCQATLDAFVSANPNCN